MVPGEATSTVAAVVPGEATSMVAALVPSEATSMVEALVPGEATLLLCRRWGDGLRGEKNKVGPATVINWDPQKKLSLDLNPGWIQKQVKG